jgi:hypothetical protein
VRFTAVHRFPAPPAAVAAVLTDPDFYRALELPDLELLEARSIEAAGGADVRLHGGPADCGVLLRYEFTGHLDPLAERLIGGERLTWTQEVHVVGESGGRLEFAAEANPRLLHGHADFLLVPEEDAAGGDHPDLDAAGGDHPDLDAAGGDHPDLDAAGASTRRQLEGDLVVALPVVGGMAERRIVRGVLARLDVEADALRERLARRTDTSDEPRRTT